ncbi:MAG: ubiquinone biosynthesis protein [Nitrosomonas sp.]|nr:ubiquinone biosynthesis protein [Nitrosomonas sp.]
MLTSIAVAPINHVIHGESWASKRLQSYAGKNVRIRVLPIINFTFTIQEDGQISTMPDDTTVDVSLSLSASMLPFLLTKNDAIYNDIKTSGDDAIAKELIDIGKHLRWDAAQDLSKVIGDIPANRIAQAGESLIDWHNKHIINLSEMLAEYCLEEQPVLAKTLSIAHFINHVDNLQEETDKLEQRINKLIDHVPT